MSNTKKGKKKGQKGRSVPRKSRRSVPRKRELPPISENPIMIELKKLVSELPEDRREKLFEDLERQADLEEAQEQAEGPEECGLTQGRWNNKAL